MRSIMVVDDDPKFNEDVVGALARELRIAPEQIERARSLEEGLHALSNRRVDVAVVDVSLGSMGLDTQGLDLLDQIRAVQPEAKVVMATRWPALNAGAKAMRHGAFAYVFKNWPGVDAVRLIVEQVRLAISCLDFDERCSGSVA